MSRPKDLMDMDDTLPPAIAQGAALRGNEYGWNISAFPSAIEKAASLGYACLGGQFQFRLNDGSTFEMYWLNADSSDRKQGEAWVQYSIRSCSEVQRSFLRLLESADFRKEALNWPVLEAAVMQGFDPATVLVFVAYFANEAEATANA